MQASSENTTLPQAMIVTTTENIPDARVVQTLGQVFGLTVRSRSLGGNITALVDWAILVVVIAGIVHWSARPDGGTGRQTLGAPRNGRRRPRPVRHGPRD